MGSISEELFLSVDVIFFSSPQGFVCHDFLFDFVLHSREKLHLYRSVSLFAAKGSL
jgi:hypothetical protein